MSKRNTAAVAALLIATIALTGCAEIDEFRMSMRESEAQPVLIDSGEAQAQTESSPQEATVQADAAAATSDGVEYTLEPQETAATTQAVPSLNLDAPKGTVIELTVVVYGTPEHEGGKLLFHAVPQEDENVCVKISVLNAPQLELAEGDMVAVVGILTDPCDGVDPSGMDLRMPLIAATDVSILSTQGAEEAPEQEAGEPQETAAPEPTADGA